MRSVTTFHRFCETEDFHTFASPPTYPSSLVDTSLQGSDSTLVKPVSDRGWRYR